MDLTAIPGLCVESDGNEVTYRLPPRPLGLALLLTLVPIGSSAVLLGVVGNIIAPQPPAELDQPTDSDGESAGNE